MIDYEFLGNFCRQVLGLDSSIRWVGMANKSGVLLSIEMRKGLKPLLSEEENEEYAAGAITRQKTRLKFEPKIGKLVYAFGRYEKLCRATITINQDYYLLITFDLEVFNSDTIIMEKVIPLIKKNSNGFTSPETSQ